MTLPGGAIQAKREWRESEAERRKDDPSAHPKRPASDPGER